MFLLLSIKPNFVKSILDGEKKYEFRKRIFVRHGIQTVYIYSSRPVQRVVGAFEIGGITKDTPQELWSRFGESAGLKEEDFFDYFNNREIGYAIQIKNLTRFKIPVDPKAGIENFTPPQNYMYLKGPIEDGQQQGPSAGIP